MIPESPENLEERILAHLRGSNYHPVKPRVIAKQMRIPPEEMVEVRRAVKRLVKHGKIVYGPRHALLLPRASTPPTDITPPTNASTTRTNSAGVAPKSRRSGTARDHAPRQELLEETGEGRKKRRESTPKETTGRLQKTAGGYGFVRPTGGGGDRELDIFVPANKCKDASDGDLVTVTVNRQRRGPLVRWQGEVVEVVERRTHQFVGTYLERDGQGFVRIDGAAFAEPIQVGDPGAKQVQPHDKVVIEMVRFPTPFRPGEGVLIQVLGDRSNQGVDTQMVLYEFGLPREFPEAALDEAREAANRSNDEIPPGFEDLTTRTVVTIDPATARDFDDAISLETLPNGNLRLEVHIADVSHFVPAGGALDREARERGTSVYLPDHVIPMLPEVISNNLASLQPDRVRLTRTAFLDFTPEGERVGIRIARTAIRSRRRFTYEEIDEYLASPDAWRSKLTPDVWELVGRMYQLAMRLRQRRLARGSIEVSMPEVKLDLDAAGQVRSASLAVNTASHQIIEEFMLAANEAVAETLLSRDTPFLHRVHPQPNPKKLATLANFLKHLGLDLAERPDRFELKRVLAEVAGQPLEKPVNLTVLKSLPKAVYSSQPLGHYALASDAYCHFTSPIRRYPDLTVHRALLGTNVGDDAAPGLTTLEMLGEHCSEREQRAERAERELVKLKLLRYFAQRVGETFSALVTGIESFGMFVQCMPIPGEGKISRESLREDTFVYDRPSMTLVGRRTRKSFQIGDIVEVQVARIDELQRVVEFAYVRHLEAHRGKKSSNMPGKDRRRKDAPPRKGKRRKK